MKKIIAIVTAFVAMVFVTGQAQAAGQLKSAKVMIDNSAENVSTSYTFQFTHASGATINKMDFNFCKQASGTCDSNPATNLAAATFNTTTTSGLPDNTAWSISQQASGHLTITATDTVISPNTIMNIKFDAINNGALDTDCVRAGGGAQPTNSSTCYIWINSYNGGTVIDSTVITYTRVAAVTISAKVDPTFTFLVSGVDSNIVRNGVTSSVKTEYNTLPFGNLTVGVAKYAIQELRVKTNTTAGYTVSAMVSTPLTGVYSSNNIDPFAAAGVGYSSPQNWAHPNGTTPNDNTGWFGFNTSDTDVQSGQYVNAKFAGLDTNARVIMSNSQSDDGTQPVYVSYALEANVFQPSDNYTGTLVYNALPTY